MQGAFNYIYNKFSTHKYMGHFLNEGHSVVENQILSPDGQRTMKGHSNIYSTEGIFDKISKK